MLIVASFLLRAEEDRLEEGVSRQLTIHQIISEIIDVLEVGLLSSRGLDSASASRGGCPGPANLSVPQPYYNLMNR